MKRAVLIVAAMIAAGCGGSDGGGTRDRTNGVLGSAGASGTGGVAGGAAPAPAGGAQLMRCTRESDCTGGLTCYTFGRYCSTRCATDTDCASMGAGYTCYVAPSFGSMGGAGTGGEARGACRLSCQGETDTSCPSGLMCIDVGGMGPTYRCAYPRTTGGVPGGAGMGGIPGTAGMSGMPGAAGAGGP